MQSGEKSGKNIHVDVTVGKEGIKLIGVTGRITTGQKKKKKKKRFSASQDREQRSEGKITNNKREKKEKKENCLASLRERR